MILYMKQKATGVKNILKLEVDELVKHFKAVSKKSKIALAVIKKVYDGFPDTQKFIKKIQRRMLQRKHFC